MRRMYIKKIKTDANLFFMHTVKTKESICSAYFDYGVRNFALDNKDELSKILMEFLTNRSSNFI